MLIAAQYVLLSTMIRRSTLSFLCLLGLQTTGRTSPSEESILQCFLPYYIGCCLRRGEVRRGFSTRPALIKAGAEALCIPVSRCLKVVGNTLENP